MLRLDDLQPNEGAKKPKKRVGRGNASHGTYSGRGIKGQRARAGFKMPPGFEGGQTPLWKRVPKRGFTNTFRKEFACVNLDVLAEKFSDGANVSPEMLLDQGLISNLQSGLKVLGRGEIDIALNIEAHRVSKSAQQKIEAAGGSVTLLEEPESAVVATDETASKAESKTESKSKAKKKPKVEEKAEAESDESE